MADPSRIEFGEFLRSRREKLSPDAVGLAGRHRRRTPGLRREEVAELAGISVDWYVRLEQGRNVSPSVATIDAVAVALQLNPVEADHLRALARNADRRVFVRETVSGTVLRLIESLDQPAYVTGRRWDVLAWNHGAVGIFTDFGAVPEEDRNILIYMLTDPGARQLFGAGWADEARRMVAQFRITYDLWAGDPAFLGLLRRLQDGCPELADWWANHDIRSSGSGRKMLSHPEQGARCFEYSAFQASDDPALKLVIYTPCDLAPQPNLNSGT